MKKMLVPTFILLCFSFLSAAQKPVLFVTGSWPPYSGKDVKNFGIYTEIAFTAFKRMNIPAKVEFYPWPRCEDMLTKGKAFASYPYIKTKKRASIYSFTTPLTSTNYVFFYYQNSAFKNFKRKDFSDLKDYRIGTVRGYFYIDLFKKYNLKTYLSNTDAQSINLLKAGRIDLYPNDLYVGLYLINQYFPNDKENFRYFLGNQFYKDPHRFMVSRKYPGSYKIFKQFNETLKRMKKSGEIKKIERKYL